MNNRPWKSNIPTDWLFHLTGLALIPGITFVASPALRVVSHLKRADINTFYSAALASGLIAAVLLFAARLPLYRTGRFWTTGSRSLDGTHRWLRRIALTSFMIAVTLFALTWARS